MDNIQELSVGQRIRARNSNGEWADAIIVSINESKYSIKWHETNTQEEVAPDAINNGRSSGKWIPFSSTSTATKRRRFSTEASPPVFGTYRTSRQYSPADLNIDENAAHISSSEQTPTSPRSAAENQSSASSNTSEPTSISSVSAASESSIKSPRGDQAKKASSKREKLKATTTNEPDKNSAVTIEEKKARDTDAKEHITADLPATAESTPRDKSLKRSSSKRNSSKRKDGITRGESKIKGTETKTPVETADPPIPKSDSKLRKNDSNISKSESKVKIKLALESQSGDNEVKSPRGEKSSTAKSPKSGKKSALDDSGSSKKSIKSPREGDIKSPRGDKPTKSAGSSKKIEETPTPEAGSTSAEPKDAKRKSDKRKSEKKAKRKSGEIQKTGEVLSPRGEHKSKTEKPDDSIDGSKTEVTSPRVKGDSKTKKPEKQDDKKPVVNSTEEGKAEIKVATAVEEPTEKPVEKPIETPVISKPAADVPTVPSAATKPKAAGAKKFLGPKMPVLKPPSQSYIPRPTDEALISPRTAAAAAKKQPPQNAGLKSPLTSPREAGPVKTGGLAKLNAPSREGSPLRVPPGASKKVPIAQVKVAAATSTDVGVTPSQTTEAAVVIPPKEEPAQSESTSSSTEISNTNSVSLADDGKSGSQEQAIEKPAEAEKEPIGVKSSTPPTSAPTSETVSPKSPRSPRGNVFVLEWAFNQTERNVHMAVGKKGTSVNWRNEEWGLAKGVAPLTHPKQFIEVVRIKGKSQQIQIGICKEDVRIEQSYKNSVISPNVIPGTWETIKVRRSKAGDVIGLLIDMEGKMLTLFVNGSPEQEASFVNKHDWGEVDQISNPIFPFFCMHGDLELQISPMCSVGKYKAINWAHGDKEQLSSANRKSQATEFFDELGLTKYRSYLDKEVDLKAITENDLKKLNIPLVPRKRILDALEKEKGGAETKN
jgi:hypothetical protein